MEGYTNPRFPHSCVITRPASEGAMSDEEEGTVIYNGICRSYEKNTTSDRGDVVTSQRILALPLTQGQWTEETMPREGDRVLVDKGSFSEWGEVTDRYPGNLGTHIFWRYGRN